MSSFSTSPASALHTVEKRSAATALASPGLLVMDQGEKKEEGNHEELLKLNGLYAKLYQRQFLKYES